MKAKSTLVGLVLLAGLSAYTIKVYQPAQVEKQEQEKFLRGSKADSIRALAISRKDASFTLKRLDEKRWEIEGLPQAELDMGNVESLLNAIEDLKLQDAIPKADLDSDLSSYGLAEPLVTVKVTDGKGEHTLKFGSTSEYSGERYVQDQESGEIYTSHTLVYSSADKPRDDFRNKSPVYFVDSEISSLEIKSDKPVTLSQSEALIWRVSAPLSARASSDAVTKLTRQLRNLKVAKFFDGTGSPVPLEELRSKPDFTATLTFQSATKKSPLILRLIRKLDTTTEMSKETGQPETTTHEILYGVLNESSTIFQFEPMALSEINEGSDGLRERNYFNFATDLAKSVTITKEDGSKIQLTKKGEDWELSGKSADSAFVRQALLDLSQVSAVDFPVESKDFGFSKPRLKIEVDEDGKTRTLVVGETFLKDNKPAGYVAATDDLKEPFVINEEGFRKLNLREEVLLPAAAQSASPSASPPQNEASEGTGH